MNLALHIILSIYARALTADFIASTLSYQNLNNDTSVRKHVAKSLVLETLWAMVIIFGQIQLVSCTVVLEL